MYAAGQDTESALARVNIDTTLSLERRRAFRSADAPFSPSPRAFSETVRSLWDTPRASDDEEQGRCQQNCPDLKQQKKPQQKTQFAAASNVNGEG
jgi:hypothetical protein